MTRRSLRGRHAYSAMVGLAVGAMLTGTVLPWAVGSSQDPSGSGGGVVSLGGGGTDAEPDAAATSTDALPGGEGTAPAAAASSGSRPAASPGAARSVAAPRDPTARVASDVGVTADAVTLGALLFDLGGVGRAGFAAGGADREQQQRMFEAFVADVNEAGGVAGRRIELQFAAFDPLRRESAFAACVAITEDAKSFLVFGTGGFVGDAITCITDQHGTPMISGQGEAEEIYARSRGRLFTSRTAANRMGRIMVDRAHAQGHLRNATIGIVVDERPHSKQPIDQAVVPRLESLGYKVAHLSRLSDDPQTGQSQIPVEISQMRSKRVDRVLFAASPIYSNLWFNQAESQGYRPLYLMSDVATMVTDFAVQSAPPSLQAIGYTSSRAGEAGSGRSQQPEGADCQARYQRRTDERVDWSADSYEIMTSICGYVQLFTRAAAAAGADLTRDRLAAALAGLGSFAFPNIGGTISFAPGKYDGADFVRTARVDGSCRCWVPVDDFVRAG